VRLFASLWIILLLPGCSVFQSNWRWEKPGSSDTDYQADIKYCKTQTEQSMDGMVNNATVRRIHHCMELRGWHKAENQLD